MERSITTTTTGWRAPNPRPRAQPRLSQPLATSAGVASPLRANLTGCPGTLRTRYIRDERLTLSPPPRAVRRRPLPRPAAGLPDDVPQRPGRGRRDAAGRASGSSPVPLRGAPAESNAGRDAGRLGRGGGAWWGAAQPRRCGAPPRSPHEPRHSASRTSPHQLALSPPRLVPLRHFYARKVFHMPSGAPPNPTSNPSRWRLAPERRLRVPRQPGLLGARGPDPSGPGGPSDRVALLQWRGRQRHCW